MTITKKEIAEIFNVSQRTIERLVQENVLIPESATRGKPQKFEVHESVKRYTSYLHDKGAAGQKDAETQRMEKERLTADLRYKEGRATITELEAQELQGKMHRSEDVAAFTEDLVYTIRGMMLALPGRLAIDAAAMTDPAEVSAFIRGEVYAILEELSRFEYDPEKYAERVRERRNWSGSSNDEEEG
ncbi:MAG: hypothetical protein FWG88_07005 [Oscillospiraceae bacterium]|nr:hypothetical protein [Oscillospiraceae bacterium]